MEAQLAQFGNRGMNQTLSISKETNEYAFKNYNIRINAINDNTALSITNERGPSLQYVEVEGNYIGHCILGDYFILFTLNNSNTIIYRINIDNDNIICKEIYKGNLNMSNNIIETIGYYESQDVQKVYWLDGKNSPRYINIMDESLINKTNVNFDFQPVVNSNLKVEITKDYNGVGLFSSGVIQYFISYYNKYGAESSIVYASPLNYISFKDRGGSPEDIITCSFNLKISNLDKNFTHIRVYSCKRTSYNGIPEAKIVTDVNIEGKDEITVIDTNTNQPLTDYTYLFFIGGKDFIASTFTQKDDTLFFGNIELKNVVISTELKEIIRNTIVEQPTGFMESSIISFNYKNVPYDKPEGYYPYTPQTKDDSTVFKTFKNGEIYRFAIQFQTNKGQWTTPVWIGDKKCELPPIVEEGNIKVADAFCNTKTLTFNILKYNQDFVNYRILYAETNSNNRSILAQGVVNPTMFNYGERYENKPFAISSWFMRPRGGNISWQHLADTKINTSDDAEIQSVDKSLTPLVTYLDSNVNGIISVSITNVAGYNQTILYGYLDENLEVIEIDKLKYITGCQLPLDSIDAIYKKLVEFYKPKGINIEDIITEQGFSEAASGNFNNLKHVKPGAYYCIKGDADDLTIEFKSGVGNFHIITPNAFTMFETELTKDNKSTRYYLDNSILTFHSPELEENQDLIDNSDLKFRIVGITPITSSFSDFEGFANSVGLSQSSKFIKDSVENRVNLSINPKTLSTGYFYQDKGWKINDDYQIPLEENILNLYKIYVWHKNGSIIGQTENSYKEYTSDSKVGFDRILADLKNKTFVTQLFSYKSEYFDKVAYDIFSPIIYNSDNLSFNMIEQNGDKFYQGNYDKLLTFENKYNMVLNDKFVSDIVDITTNKELKIIDPIRIKYKSSTHGVISLKNQILPKLSSETSFEDYFREYYGLNFEYEHLIWNYQIVNQDIISLGLYYLDVNDNQSSDKCYELYNRLLEENKFELNQISDKQRVIALVYNDRNDFSKIHGYIEFIKTVNNLSVEFNFAYSFNDLPYFNIDVYDKSENINITSKIAKLVNHKLEFAKNITKYEQKEINYNCKYPYLYLGELYRDIPYETLYGGLDDNNLEQLTWIPCSKSNNIIHEQTVSCEGDTYFQRWDCLKTYPFTEDDINKVVDITSFMVETHINLDGRYDRNRGVGNLLNVRPDNFGLRNNVYSQPNNLFTYNVLDEKFDNTKYGNQIMWSLQKNPTSDIDGWTSISTSNVLNLNGLYGDVTKLITSNDRIYSFQPKSINIINFNSKVVLQTDNNVPVEIANSAKVDGYVAVTNNNGCKNKNSIVSTQSGIYFIDDYNKSLLRINNEGLNNVSQNMSIWFKDNLTEEEFLFYDSLNNDIYLINKDSCLIYNEALQSFTSFMDYQNMQTLFNLNGKTYAMHNDKLYKMFEGEYNSTFTDLRYNGYSMEYRINPSAHTDNIFTNVEFYADLMLPYNKVSDKDITVKLDAPFNKLEVWNEYQKGETNITERYKYPNAEKKFRMWRLDIPRDSKNKLDRMRNPWIHLKLSNDTFNSDRSMRTTNDLKMIFHNLVVKYYK